MKKLLVLSVLLVRRVVASVGHAPISCHSEVVQESMRTSRSTSGVTLLVPAVQPWNEFAFTRALQSSKFRRLLSQLGSLGGCFRAPGKSCCESIPIRETVPNIPVAKGRGPGSRRMEATARGTLFPNARSKTP